LGLGELHLQGGPNPFDSGSFVREDARFGPNLSGTIQSTPIDLESRSLSTTAQLDSAGAFARVQISTSPARDDLAFTQVLIQRRSIGPSAILEAGAGHAWWLRTRLQSLEGRPGWQVAAGRTGTAFEASIEWEEAQEAEDWSFSLPTGEALGVGWNSHRSRQAVGLSLAPNSPLCLTGNASWTRFSPTSGFPYWNLTDSGASRRWEIAWKPRWQDLRGVLSHRAFQGNLTTLGWGQDSGQERRRFHALKWALAGFRQEAGVDLRRMSVRFGRQEATLELTDLRAPFLAWNNLDDSPWGSMAALFETRNDRLKGLASLRSQWLSLTGRRSFGRLRAEAGLELTHLELESSLPWSRRRRSIDFSTSLETDTLRIRPLDALILWPSLKLARTHGQWDIALSAVQALPLRVRQTADPSASNSVSPLENSKQGTTSGGLTVRASLTRRL
jgi:hypothetical protein